MATQISWGVGFNEVLRNLVKRVGTKLIARSVSLVDEANKAGGKISDVLTTAANDAAEIKWLQKERKRGVTMYVAVIYISFGVYLAVIAIIVAVFLPAIIDASQSMIAGGAGAGAAMGGLQVRVLEREKLTFLFFCSVIVQSIGNGLMAGLMGEGKVTAGLKHVFLMVLIGWLIFWAMGTYM
jgi:flagellar protein FlaJ